MKGLMRYERHVELDGIDIEGQQRLLQAKVLLIGAGGIGCVAGTYLAAAGIGYLTVMDDDVVSLSNLQRQITYSTNDINQPKVKRLQCSLEGLNPDVEIKAIEKRIDEESASHFISGHDVVLDGSDNFETRYLLNKACCQAQKPLVSGSILYYDGQVSVFKSYEPGLPCYKCLYPHRPDPSEVPSCNESAVLGPVPGVIATMAAVECIKEILNLGETLAGKLLLYSALTSECRKVSVAKNESCDVCAVG